MTLPSYQKDILKWLTGVACMVGTLATAGHFLFPEVDSARVPASVPNVPAQDKSNILKGDGADGSQVSGKGGGSLRIEIRTIDSGTSPAGQPLVGQPIQLQALVQAMHPMKALQFAWHLPRGVAATEGDVTGEIGDLAENESRVLTLTVTTTTQDNRQIHLNVFRKEGDENLGDVAQFNTVPNPKATHNGEMLKAESLEKPDAHLIQ